MLQNEASKGQLLHCAPKFIVGTRITAPKTRKHIAMQFSASLLLRLETSAGTTTQGTGAKPDTKHLQHTKLYSGFVSGEKHSKTQSMTGLSEDSYGCH